MSPEPTAEVWKRRHARLMETNTAYADAMKGLARAAGRLREAAREASVWTLEGERLALTDERRSPEQETAEKNKQARLF